MKKFLRNWGLTLAFLFFFLASWVGQLFTGWQVLNDERLVWGLGELTLTEYLFSGHFWEATFENWESEFLQMGTFVVLTIWFFQKGSSESKDPDDPHEQDREEAKFKKKFFAKSPVLRTLYENSLSISLLSIFMISIALHSWSAFRYHEFQITARGEAPETYLDFIRSSDFWFQSFQNWQSEFLSIAVLAVLSIFLRQKGSPQSKPVDAPHSYTGQ